MTRREQQIFERDIQRRYEELVETFKYSAEEAIEIATDDAQMAYDDAMDSRMESIREKEWE